MRDGPLDMRMDVSQGITLAEWLEQAKEQDIVQVLREYGEEPYARSIARSIMRETCQLRRLLELADIITAARPYSKKKHPATRSFQAFRIYINRELESLTQCS